MTIRSDNNGPTATARTTGSQGGCQASRSACLKHFTRTQTPQQVNRSSWHNAIFWAIACTLIFGVLAIGCFAAGSVLGGVVCIAIGGFIGYIWGPPFTPIGALFIRRQDRTDPPPKEVNHP